MWLPHSWKQDQALWWEVWGEVAPGRAGRFAPLGGAHLFFAGPAQPGNGTAHNGGTDALPMPLLPELAMLLQHGIVVGGQLRWQVGVQGGSISGGATRNGFARQAPRYLVLLEIVLDCGQRDLEQGRHLGARRAVIDGMQHSLSEVD